MTPQAVECVVPPTPGSKASASSGRALFAVQESLVSEEVVHDLDTCEVTVEGEELNPEQESLEVDTACLQHKGMEVSSSDLGVIFTGERPEAPSWDSRSPRRAPAPSVSGLGACPGGDGKGGASRDQTTCRPSLPCACPYEGRGQACGSSPQEGGAPTHLALAPAVGKPNVTAGPAGPGAWLQPALALALPCSQLQPRPCSHLPTLQAWTPWPVTRRCCTSCATGTGAPGPCSTGSSSSSAPSSMDATSAMSSRWR